MSEFKNKNTDELLSKFFKPAEAEQIKNDFASADGLFEEFSAPKPSERTIKEIKRQINARLSVPKQAGWRNVLLRTAAVAAIVVVVFAIMQMGQKPESQQYTSIDTQADVSLTDEADLDVSLYETEAQQLRDELVTINLGEENGMNGILVDRIDKIELEIIEIKNNFWKG